MGFPRYLLSREASRFLNDQTMLSSDSSCHWWLSWLGARPCFYLVYQYSTSSTSYPQYAPCGVFTSKSPLDCPCFCKKLEPYTLIVSPWMESVRRYYVFRGCSAANIFFLISWFGQSNLYYHVFSFTLRPRYQFFLIITMNRTAWNLISCF